jgi:hypothetical protein
MRKEKLQMRLAMIISLLLLCCSCTTVFRQNDSDSPKDNHYYIETGQGNHMYNRGSKAADN